MDPNAISNLMKALKALDSSDGSMSMDEMWNDCFPIPGVQEDTKTGQETAIAQALLFSEMDSSRRELRNILDGLRSLTSSLEKKISSVNITYKPLFLSNWMNTAPAEILDNIFEEACSGNRWEAWNICQVNRRFYNIATQNPHLWNKVTNFDKRDSSGDLRVDIMRSKKIGLNLEMDFQRFGVISGVDILEAACPEAYRWESVIYWTNYQESLDWREVFEDINYYSANLDLPRLKSATIHFPQEGQLTEEMEDDFINLSEPLLHFYKTWFAPNLTKLKVYNLFPLPFSRLAPPLTTLQLVIDDLTSETRVYDMNLLLDFLRSCPLLETLSLKFDIFTPSTASEPARALPELVLPNLRTFEYLSLSVESGFLRPFLGALRFPVLQQLHVYDGRRDFNYVFPLSQENYANVEVLSYKLRFPPSHEPCYSVFVDLFTTLPNLRSLTLDSPQILPRIDEWSSRVKLPRLRDIHFVGCNNASLVALALFRRLLEEQEKWDVLKEVTFTECNHLHKGSVNAIFHGKTVTWYSERVEQDYPIRDLMFSDRE